MILCKTIYYTLMMSSGICYILSLYFLFSGIDYFVEYTSFSINSVNFEMVIYLDWIVLMFMSFVLLISGLIIKYSNEYMGSEKNLKRFIYLMVLFVASMMLMITSMNLVSILLGWDGLGLVSYLLVIYYQNMKSYNAGMLTALSNRIGDASILLGIFWFMDMGSWNYMFYTSEKVQESVVIVSMLMVMAAMTKSAQIPFSSWLPAAMAAPTPVSSLVHSSTLVTAGVYMLIRFSDFFSKNLMNYLLFFSLLTMFMAGLGANFEYDLKKIIALSTLSQLGMMIVILSLGDKMLAFFHLLIHALFKALLFMCAGVMIHNMSGIQDIRYYSGLIKFMPVTCVCVSLSSMALCGMPFLVGFYSKDLIAEMLSYSNINMLVYMLFFMSVGFTVSYSFRIIYYILFGKCNMICLNYMNEDNNEIMVKSMLGLIFFVILKGSLLVWLIFSVPYFIILPLLMKMLTLMMILFGSWLGYELAFFNYRYKLKSLEYKNMTMFMSGMWNMPILSTSSMNYFCLNLGKIFIWKGDYGWMEFYGSKNLFDYMKYHIFMIQLLSRNHIKLMMLLILSFMLFMFLFIF
uniref:NADH-ubiquinone oxidoreductase chain 5 n=1 Tax=Setarhynchus sp. AH-2016 TaxID=1903834 RepID=A0A343C586_9CUCU|nr:NADH dehydrogenase subunit 5 [Setarhynchus sp. AH-2016]